jgi:hypothetical protein
MWTVPPPVLPEPLPPEPLEPLELLPPPHALSAPARQSRPVAAATEAFLILILILVPWWLESREAARGQQAS